jgi:transcriptional regulator with XRE-family HTH domain
MGRNLREGCHVSLHEVAAALGVTASAVSRWETGTEPRGANATRYGALCRLWLDMQTTFDAVEG